MKCQRIGCNNRFKGSMACAKVFVQDKRGTASKHQKRHEKWCLECATILDPSKYTLEYYEENHKMKMRRVPGGSLADGAHNIPGKTLTELAPVVQEKPKINLADAKARKEALKKRRKSRKNTSFITDELGPEAA